MKTSEKVLIGVVAVGTVIAALAIFAMVGAQKIEKLAPESVIERVSSESESRAAKEAEESSDGVTLNGENTDEDTKVTQETKQVSRTDKKTNESVENDLYTPDGALRYATTDPDMVRMRRVLLEKWREYTGSGTVNWDLVRLNESPGGFSVSAGGVNWGSIEDKGNNKFDFVLKEGAGAMAPYVVKGTETVPYQ